MTILTTTSELATLCRHLAGGDYVAVDTEFMRENTYWPKLCLVQLAGRESVAAVDPLAEGIDLAPLFELMADPNVVKVFHAARQDIEIFYNLAGRVPGPLFDTQVAAMVCSFGDSVGYETLASTLASATIDKSMRFTDWSRRPLSKRQLDYALSDVIHLRVIYANLRQCLGRNGRLGWLDEEMALLTDPATYANPPEQAWRRMKFRSHKPRFLGVLRALAAWREREARRRDLPRQRVVRDEALIEIAAHPPKSTKDLADVRGMSRGLAEGRLGHDILNVVAEAMALPESELPHLEKPRPLPSGLGPLVELLKVLLKTKCEIHGVAAKLVATSADLERIAADDAAQAPALHGWRWEIFGADALALKQGRLAIAAEGRRVRLIPLEEGRGGTSRLTGAGLDDRTKLHGPGEG